jgi:hypothetical protein
MSRVERVERVMGGTPWERGHLARGGRAEARLSRTGGGAASSRAA